MSWSMVTIRTRRLFYSTDFVCLADNQFFHKAFHCKMSGCKVDWILTAIISPTFTQKTNNLIWFIMHTKRFPYSWIHNSPTLLLFWCVCETFTSKERCTQTTMRSVNWNRIKVYQYIWTGLGMFWTHIISMSTTEVSLYMYIHFIFFLHWMMLKPV